MGMEKKKNEIWDHLVHQVRFYSNLIPCFVKNINLIRSNLIFVLELFLHLPKDALDLNIHNWTIFIGAKVILSKPLITILYSNVESWELYCTGYRIDNKLNKIISYVLSLRKSANIAYNWTELCSRALKSTEGFLYLSRLNFLLILYR